MSRRFAGMSFAIKLTVILSVFVVGFAASGVFSFATLHELKVNGPVYQGIVRNKDLLADILPPPEYLVESYLVSLQMASAEESKLPALMAKSKSLTKEFDDRREYWMGELPDGEIKTLLVDKAYQPGKEFLALQQQQLIPALQRGDRDLVAALLSQLERKYEEHRSAIDELVKRATDDADLQEKGAASLTARKSTPHPSLS